MSRGNRSNGRRFDRRSRGTWNSVFPRYRGLEGRASNGGVQELDRLRVRGDPGSGLGPPARPGLPGVPRSVILIPPTDSAATELRKEPARALLVLPVGVTVQFDEFRFLLPRILDRGEHVDELEHDEVQRQQDEPGGDEHEGEVDWMTDETVRPLLEQAALCGRPRR